MNNVHKPFLHKTHYKLYKEQLSDSTGFLKVNLENKFYFDFILWSLWLNL